MTRNLPGKQVFLNFTITQQIELGIDEDDEAFNRHLDLQLRKQHTQSCHRPIQLDRRILHRNAVWLSEC
ncbi:hypothetical protein SDC9_132089 [bioreactor metagenome]|uniref:Uncharacterized protein n=1 Tax=bioreactor metagenome TaxID=1076179 RepID=A0A645D8S2_9ZZZZ